MKLLQALWRKRRTNESYFRYIFGLLHLWTGLFVGIIISVISLTGALYVFAEEYDDIENHKYIKADYVADSLISLDAAVQNYKDTYDLLPGGLYIPADKQKNITIANRGFGNDRVKVYVDRESGEFVGQAGNKSKVFTYTLVKLHRWLMFKDMNKGRRFVGYCTFIFIFLLISGLVIWFPRSLKATKHSFKIKLKGSFNVVNRQLHVNLGFYLTIFLILIALVGTCITFPPVRQKVIGALVPDEPAKKEKTMSKDEHRAIWAKYKSDDFSFDKMLAISDDVLGYESDRNIYFPTHHFNEFSVLAVNPNNFLGGTWTDVVTFDLKGNYKVTYFFNDMPFYQQVNQLIKPLHTGEIFGTKSKIFYFLLALFSAFLPISGFILWWKRIVRKF